MIRRVGLEPTTLRLTAGSRRFCRMLPHVALSCSKEPISLGVKNLPLAGRCRVLLEVAASCGAQKAKKGQCPAPSYDTFRASSLDVARDDPERVEGSRSSA